MPTYDYRCAACGHAFEHFQSISSRPLRKCPGCGKTRLERLIGAGGGLLFKGSGFYVTDYRPSSWHDAAKKDAPAPGPADGAAGPAGAKPGASPTPGSRGGRKGGPEGGGARAPGSSPPAARPKKARP